MAETPAEHAVLDALRNLAAVSVAYRAQLQACQPYVNHLAEDYGPAANLSVSVMVALGDRLGSPAHVERSVHSILGELGPHDA